jgi:hypothetical protein
MAIVAAKTITKEIGKTIPKANEVIGEKAISNSAIKWRNRPREALMILSTKSPVAHATTKRKSDRRWGRIMVAVEGGAGVVMSSPTGTTGGEGVFASGRDSFSVSGAGITRYFP